MNCEHCGRSLPIWLRKDAKFCNDACRFAHWKRYNRIKGKGKVKEENSNNEADLKPKPLQNGGDTNESDKIILQSKF